MIIIKIVDLFSLYISFLPSRTSRTYNWLILFFFMPSHSVFCAVPGVTKPILLHNFLFYGAADVPTGRKSNRWKNHFDKQVYRFFHKQNWYIIDFSGDIKNINTFHNSTKNKIFYAGEVGGLRNRPAHPPGEDPLNLAEPLPLFLSVWPLLSIMRGAGCKG